MTRGISDQAEYARSGIEYGQRIIAGNPRQSVDSCLKPGIEGEVGIPVAREPLANFWSIVDPQVTDQEYGATGGHVYGRLGRGNAECNVSEASKCRALGAVAALLAQEFASEIVSLRARAGAGDARDHSHGRTDGGVRALGLVRAAVGMVV